MRLITSRSGNGTPSVLLTTMLPREAPAATTRKDCEAVVVKVPAPFCARARTVWVPGAVTFTGWVYAVNGPSSMLIEVTGTELSGSVACTVMVASFLNTPADSCRPPMVAVTTGGVVSVPVIGRSMSTYWILVFVPPMASTSSTPSVTSTVAVPVVSPQRPSA